MDDEVLWRGRPVTAAYVWRWWRVAGAAGAIALTVGVYWEYLALSGHHLIVYPLVGLLFLALGTYGLLVRPLLLWRAATDLEYVVDEHAVSLRRRRRAREVWSIPGDRLPPVAVVPTRGVDDVHLLGVAPLESPWGWWLLVDVRLQFSCLTPAAAEAARAAIERLRKERGVARPAAWAAGLATPRGTRYPGYDPQPDDAPADQAAEPPD